MATYAAAPTTTANNSNQKAAQSRSGIINTLVLPVITAQSTTDNNSNQKAAQSGTSKAILILLLTQGVDAAPKPGAINTGGGQAGYAG